MKAKRAPRKGGALFVSWNPGLVCLDLDLDLDSDRDLVADANADAVAFLDAMVLESLQAHQPVASRNAFAFAFASATRSKSESKSRFSGDLSIRARS